MIYVRFNKYGVLENINYNDETIFKGNNKTNQLFISFDEITLKPTHYLTYSALVNDNDYKGDLSDLASIRTTINGEDGFTFYLFSNLTAQAGTLKLSVRLVDRVNEEVLVSGIIPLIVQDSAVSTYASVNITTTQYQAILVALNESASKEFVAEQTDNLYEVFDSRTNALNDSNNKQQKTIDELKTENGKQAKKIKQLELASEGTILETITEGDFVYSLNVGENTLPYATINKVGGLTIKSENLLNPELLNPRDGTFTKQSDNSFISKALGTYGTAYFNSTWNSSLSSMVSINGIALSKGTYYISLKAKLNSGTSTGGLGIIMTLSNSKQVTATAILNPSISSEYQEYKRSFTLTNDDLIGLNIQVGNSTNAVIQIKDIMISKVNVNYQPYFEGLRDTKVTEIISAGANLQKEKWSGLNSTITLSTPLKANEKYTMCIYVTTNVADGKGINVFDEKDNQLFSNSLASWGQPVDGWNSFVITPTIDTKTLRINAYGIVSKEMEGAILKGALVPEKKYNSINLFKPYKQPTAIAIPTAIQNLDGYGKGVSFDSYNYIDLDNKSFIKTCETNIIDETDETQFVVSAEYGNNIRFKLKKQNAFQNGDAITYLNSKLKAVAFNKRTNDLNDMRFYLSYLDGYYWFECRDTKANAIFTSQAVAKKWMIENASEFVYLTTSSTIIDIADYLDDNIIKVEQLGTLTFENEYNQEALIEWTFQEKL